MQLVLHHATRYGLCHMLSAWLHELTNPAFVCACQNLALKLPLPNLLGSSLGEEVAEIPPVLLADLLRNVNSQTSALRLYPVTVNASAYAYDESIENKSHGAPLVCAVSRPTRF